MKQNWWAKLTPEQKQAIYAKRRKRYADDPGTRQRGRALCRRWHHSNPRHKKRALKWRYGISEDQYNQKVEFQKDLCGICGEGREARKYRPDLVIDHDHATGKMRSLLCDHCNKAIGFMKDNPARLRAAADYLESHRA